MGKVIYEIRYNDGVLAERITFQDWTEEHITEHFKKVILEYNKNPNVDYHITMENIKKVSC